MFKKLFILVLLFVISTKTILSVNYPDPAGYVNDFAGLYSQSFKDSLEKQLSDFDKQTGNEFSVATIKSLEGNDINDYAVRLFEKWKIGKKGQDNGLLLLISKEDREVRIEVGYGLEQYINDARSGDVIRNQFVPEFKNGNYEKGTLDTVNKLEEYVQNKELVPETPAVVKGPTNILNRIFSNNIEVWLVIFGMFGSYIAGYLGRSKEIWPGALIGGLIGGVGGLLAASIIGLFIGGVFFSVIGLFFDWLLSKNYKERLSQHKQTNFWGSGGGFFGGGGSSGGGGFGGFGGGSSGGGGASGKW